MKVVIIVIVVIVVIIVIVVIVVIVVTVVIKVPFIYFRLRHTKESDLETLRVELSY